MKKTTWFSLMLAGWVLSGGCVVQSIHPWLSEQSRIDEPDLTGTWHDANNNTVAFFHGSPESYKVLLVTDGKIDGHFEATLHRVDDTLLLLVGPQQQRDLEALARIPGHLLLKACLDNDTLALHPIDLPTFEARSQNGPIPLLPGGSKKDGYVLTGTADEVEAFLRSQLADPGFFYEKPLYSFRKLPAS